MKTSVRWINDYLDPIAGAEEQAELLTRAGLPFDGRDVIGDDIQQEIETTSNRGDCLCHIGLAREIAALSGRALKSPAPPEHAAARPGSRVSTAPGVSVTNERPDLCPLYTARVIRGVTIGPSPEWLASRLRAIGQIPRNNVVDATNFVLFEWGQPTHVFDLTKLEGPAIIVRLARDGEPFLPIGEGAAEVRLRGTDLVIADAGRAVAIAGVKGGALTAVTNTTTDILLEAATFAPTAVRAASRGLRISSDSSYRFERGVHPAQVNPAADRLAEIILAVAGGELCTTVVSDGAPLPEPRRITLRFERCRRLLGIDLPTERIVQWLSTLGFDPRVDGEVVHCVAPHFRLDIEREVDLVEEVARMAGLDLLPVVDTVAIRPAPPQPVARGRQCVRDLLAGLGAVESITHSLISEEAATPFLPPGCTALRVEDERARAEPILRPSVVPSLLRVRRHNQDAGVAKLSLFEIASVFHVKPDGAHHEHESLAIVADHDQPELELRPLRGVIERLVELLVGRAAKVAVSAPEEGEGMGWLGAQGVITLDGTAIGRLGLVRRSVQDAFGLDRAVVAAEITLQSLLALYPPQVTAGSLPAFPAIERDLSVLVPEEVNWKAVQSSVEGLGLPHLEAVEFVTVFRGKNVPSGSKSLTLRLRFRAGERTLRAEEVDPSVAATVGCLGSRFGAQVRS